MATHRYAILIDGGFFFRKLWQQLGERPSVDQVVAEIDVIRDHDLVRGYELLRAYYYDARPATGNLTNPVSGQNLNLGNSEVFKKNQAFFESLELRADISLRSGELSPHGWKLSHVALKDKSLKDRKLTADDFVPDIEQKGVDLRIGLDIARLSLRSLVQTIVVVTGDSDFVPAFKFARREGVRVILRHMNHGVKKELRAHTDGIME